MYPSMYFDAGIEISMGRSVDTSSADWAIGVLELTSFVGPT